MYTWNFLKFSFFLLSIKGLISVLKSSNCRKKQQIKKKKEYIDACQNEIKEWEGKKTQLGSVCIFRAWDR